MGSDLTSTSSVGSIMRFNPRSHMGSDVCCRTNSKELEEFQSTLPHGERLRKVNSIYDFESFNPRSHMGSDLRTHVVCFRKVYVSIHAPTWGATDSLFDCVNTDFVSIHAPTWGATLQTPWVRCTTEFQSTLPHGERPSLTSSLQLTRCFNPRSHMGSD